MGASDSRGYDETLLLRAEKEWWKKRETEREKLLLSQILTVGKLTWEKDEMASEACRKKYKSRTELESLMTVDWWQEYDLRI